MMTHRSKHLLLHGVDNVEDVATVAVKATAETDTAREGDQGS